jgi:hypothetical protein
MTDQDHAGALIRAFVARDRQARYLELLGSPRGRTKLRAALAHFADLDARTARRLTAADQDAVSIEELLGARGAPAECVLLAEDAALDGRRLPLGEALAAVVGSGRGAFLSCVAGRLAYFEGEEPGERYLLERPPDEARR